MEAEAQREMSEVRQADSSTQRVTFLLNPTHPKRARLLASLSERSGRPPTPPPQYEIFSTHTDPSADSGYHNSEFNRLPQIERQVRIVVHTPWWHMRRAIALVAIVNALIIGAVLGGVLGSASLARQPSTHPGSSNPSWTPVSLPYPAIPGSPRHSTTNLAITTTSTGVGSQVTISTSSSVLPNLD